MNRHRKKSARYRRQEQRDSRRMEAVARVFDTWVGKGAFRRLGECGRRRLLRSLAPPELVTHSSLVTDPDGLRVAVRAGLAGATFTLNGAEFPWLDVYSVLTTVARLEREIVLRSSGVVGTAGSTLDRARTARAIQAVRASVADILETVVAGLSDPGRALYWYRTETAAGGRLRVELGEERPQVVSASIDGKPRPAYRVGGCWSGGGFRWVDWPPGAVGANATGLPTPVYVQAHALDRLRERVPVPPADRHLSLVTSLAAPVVAARDGDALFVKFVLFGEFHIGHLVTRPIPAGALVTTFLFLTMQSTPEYYRLRAALQLRRPDVEYVGLDDLRSFVNSDLADDPELAEVFRTCGCGDLLKLRTEEQLDRSPLRAGTLRRYLGK